MPGCNEDFRNLSQSQCIFRTLAKIFKNTQEKIKEIYSHGLVSWIDLRQQDWKFRGRILVLHSVSPSYFLTHLPFADTPFLTTFIGIVPLGSRIHSLNCSCRACFRRLATWTLTWLMVSLCSCFSLIFSFILDTLRDVEIEDMLS